MGNLSTPENIQQLQTALHAKAKGEPNFRFYSLYDKVHRRDVLEYAYACCRANQGAAGVDGERFEDIETYGVERWLGELADTLIVINTAWGPLHSICSSVDRIAQGGHTCIRPIYGNLIVARAETALTGCLNYAATGNNFNS